MPVDVKCPECGEELVAKTPEAAALVLGCVDHPTPNVQPAQPKVQRCVEVGPWGRCVMNDMHASLHQVPWINGEVRTWARYDKWNRWYKDETVEMALPKEEP